jgi:type 1 glutamine amidotransferase
MNPRLPLRIAAVLLAAAAVLCSCKSFRAPDKKIVFVAGTPSHGPGEHEYRAGCLLLQKCLEHVRGLHTVVYSNGWPTDPRAFDGADAIVLSMDGGGGHALLQDGHLQQLSELMDKGAGLACIHWAVEPTPDKGEKELVEWMGGAFEPNWSVNPTWTADFTTLPEHPITRGVKPFRIYDEWYFHMRFPDGMKGITPILAAVPPASTMDRPDGPWSGNPAVRAAVKNGESETVAWAYDRPGGGRGFGFTGAHYHKNWGNENFRKVVLNGILWIAHKEVPKNGVASEISDEDLGQNLDDKKK